MSDWIGFQLKESDIHTWAQGITPCPIQAALEHATIDWMTFNETTQRWQRQGKPSEVFTKPFRGMVQMGNQLYELCGKGKRFQRHIREAIHPPRFVTPEELIRADLIYPTRLWVRWYGESDYDIDWLRKCQSYQPERQVLRVPKVTGMPLDDDMACDLMRERGLL